MHDLCPTNSEIDNWLSFLSQAGWNRHLNVCWQCKEYGSHHYYLVMVSEQKIDQHSQLLYSIYCKCAVMSSRFHPDLLSRFWIYTIILDFNFMIDRIELGKSEDILGEFNPGFSLWTSAHGFSHFRLSESKNWRRFWGVVIILAIIGLLSTFIFYSYQVK